MSLDFALKDITRKWDHSISYIKAIALIFMIPIFFIYFLNGLNLLFSNTQVNYNFTTYDLYSQYFQFFVYATIIISIIWIIIINHSIITHKSKDLAIMKAVGTMKNRLNSFYYLEVLIIDILGLALGIFLGFFIYLIMFFVFSSIGFDLRFYLDLYYTPLIIIIALGLSYIINGIELNTLTDKRYAEISSGDIVNGYNAVGGLRLIPKLLSKISFSFKIGITSLVRKKKLFYRILIVVSISMIGLVTLSTGTLFISSNINSHIRGSQSDSRIVIGHEDVVNQYVKRYEEFSNGSISYDMETNYLDSKYLFSQNIVDQLTNNDSFNSINYWDSRLFFYSEAVEQSSVVITGQFNNYYEPGQNRRAIIPVVGLQYKNYIEDWIYFGEQIDNSSIVVGDTLANSFFDAATYQKLGLKIGNTVYSYQPDAILYDTFCAGNASYIPLDMIQEDLGLENQLNLIILGYDQQDSTQIINHLQNEISQINEDFIVVDLENVFQENEDSLNKLMILSLILALILLVFVVWSLTYYQKANFEEKSKDFAVIRAIGGKSKLIKNIMLIEDSMILLLAMGYSYGFSLLFNNLFLIGSSEIDLPPLGYVTGIWFFISMTVLILIRITISQLYKKLKTQELSNLKVFEK